MKAKISFRSCCITTITFAHVLLFTYAATSKLFDFENFQIQLAQSPLLSAFAGWIAFATPLSEYLIVILLLIKRFRLIGLYASFTLMVMFTAYIYIILNYSEFIPCSCGGILEKMTWNQHLLFNLAFVALSALAILLYTEPQHTLKIKWVALTLGSFFGITSIALLFQQSENIIHYHNTFVRRFPQHIAQQVNEIELTYNSYYFAGSDNRYLYLGNTTAPLKMTVIDLTLKTKTTHQIQLKQQHLPFRSPQIRVLGNYFFVFEGTVPYVFRGKTSSWTATLQINSGHYFSQLEPIDSTTIALRYIHPKTGENTLGIQSLSDTTKTILAPNLLQKQIDGIFDTDGSLHINHKLHSVVYVHRYRNEFINANHQLQLNYRGKTIDTISHAQIQLAKVKSHNIKTFAAPPLIVNKSSATAGNLLFVNSQIIGQYESDVIWKNASIIDVYNLTNQSYQSSFPIYHSNGKRMRSFIITNNQLFALIGSQLVRYQLTFKI